jgi:DNA-binding IclR family transcriptional regulator
VLKLTPVHDVVLSVLDSLPENVEADAALVADLLSVPEAEAARLLDDLEEAGRVEDHRIQLSPTPLSPCNRGHPPDEYL